MFDRSDQRLYERVMRVGMHRIFSAFWILSSVSLAFAANEKPRSTQSVENQQSSAELESLGDFRHHASELQMREAREQIAQLQKAQNQLREIAQIQARLRALDSRRRALLALLDGAHGLALEELLEDPILNTDLEHLPTENLAFELARLQAKLPSLKLFWKIHVVHSIFADGIAQLRKDIAPQSHGDFDTPARRRLATFEFAVVQEMVRNLDTQEIMAPSQLRPVDSGPELRRRNRDILQALESNPTESQAIALLARWFAHHLLLKSTEISEDVPANSPLLVAGHTFGVGGIALMIAGLATQHGDPSAFTLNLGFSSIVAATLLYKLDTKWKGRWARWSLKRENRKRLRELEREYVEGVARTCQVLLKKELPATAG